MRRFTRRLLEAFEGLSRNERLLVSAAGGLLVVGVVLLGIVQPLLAARDRAEQRATAATQQVEAVRELRHRYDEVSGRLAAVEKRIRSGPSGEIFTSLEKMAQQSAVKIDSMEPRTTPASEEYRETKVQLTLKGVTLAQVVGYLHRIENAPQLLSIKTLRIRTRSDKPDLLDVTFTVSSFEPL